MLDPPFFTSACNLIESVHRGRFLPYQKRTFSSQAVGKGDSELELVTVGMTQLRKESVR